MIDIPLNKALVAAEIGYIEGKCEHCFFHREQGCSGVLCDKTEREDGKNVIFKLVDWPGEK